MRPYRHALYAASILSGLIPATSFAQSATTLQPIVVEADPDGKVEETTAGPVQGLRALTAKSATKTATPIEELPQSLQVVPRSLIDAQSSITVSEAARNVSNVQPVDTLMIGNVEQVPVRIRGFGAEQWTDGYAGNLFLAGDREGLVNVERVEVLKGPNALLYGGGAGSPVGGAINVISKMPTDTPFYEVGGTVGTDNYWSPFVDLNQPLDENGRALFRLTAEYTSNDSHIDVLESDRYSVHPTLTLTNRSDTSLTLQGFASEHRQQAYIGLPVTGTLVGDFELPTDLFIGHPDIERSYSKDHGVTATFDHAFNGIWSTNIKARWSQSEMDQHAQPPFLDASGTGGTPFLPPSTFDLNNTEHYDEQQEFSFNPSLQADFRAGPTKNTVLLGLDYSRVTDTGFMHTDTLGNYCYLLGGGCTPVTVDLTNPTYTVPYTRPQPGVGEGVSYFDFDNTYITKGAYGQVQTTLFDRVHLLGGARLASIDMTYNDTATGSRITWVTEETKLLPRAGVVVDLLDSLSVYASYGEGMKWVPFSQTLAQPKPETSKQYEAGVKINLDDRLTGTLAVFQINRENVPYRISVTETAMSKQTSRGFEADLLYQVDEHWSLLGSYGYTDAFFDGDGGASAPDGNKLPFVPEHSGRLWANYAFGNGMLDGWSAGAGVYLASGQYVDAQNVYKTEGYHTFDAKVGYEEDRFRLALTLKNLTDEDYLEPYTWFGGQVSPGAPRSAFLQFSYKFN